MRKFNVLLLAALLALAIPTVVQAAGGGAVSHSTPGSASSTSQMSVTIPSVVAIDVETDVTFDLTNYIGGTGCANNFPPSISCSTATFAPTSASTTTGATPAPTGYDIFVSVFDNKAGAAVSVGGFVDAAWSPSGGPGFVTTMFATKASSGNNTSGTGNASFANLTTSNTAFGTQGLPPGAFGWTRIDQAVEINLTTIPTTFNAGTFTTNVHFQITSS
jgi:hypothetical protein